MPLTPLVLHDGNAENRGSRFGVSCTACNFERVIGIDVLKRLGGRESDMADAARRIRCSRCGGRRIEVHVVTESK